MSDAIANVLTQYLKGSKPLTPPHMASLSPLTTTANSSTASTTTALSSSASSPFSQPATKLSLLKNQNRRRFPQRISCNASPSERNSNHSQNEPSLGMFDRRNVLLGLGAGGLYGVSGLNSAMAAPILPPDFSECEKADIPAGGVSLGPDCCPPNSSTIIDFKLPPKGSPMRVRPAAHLADEKYIAKFKKAVELMRALPDSDPRSFSQQADVHCAYCNGAYHQVGFPDLDLQVHDSWIFFPFHRAYLYFFERILGKLVGDPNFAIPYWNWDSPAGMSMPAMYADSNSSLYDKIRSAGSAPPNLINLDFNGHGFNEVPNEQRSANNLSVMYREMVSSGKNATLFLGAAYRAGSVAGQGGGTLERVPHTAVHGWVGDPNQPNLEDMGNFYSAGRDPIFYGHHANVDRTWDIWKTLGGKKQRDFTDPDWLESAFLLYDENKNLVRIKVKDVLDSSKLRYTYQKVDLPWLKSKPKPRRDKKTKEKNKDKAGVAQAAEEATGLTPLSQFPILLNKTVNVQVSRPRKSRSKQEKEDDEEILLIENIELDKNKFVKFDVFINDEDEPISGPGNSEFAGSFTNTPHKHATGHKSKTNLRLGLTDLLEDLEADDDETVIVTLVPRSGTEDVKIGGVKIEFLDD